MKRRALFMAVAAVMAAVLIGGGITFALFTASTDTVDATFSSGTLELEGNRDQGDTLPGPMFYTTKAEGETTPGAANGKLPTGFWAPGDEHHRVFQIENIGTLDALLKSASAMLDAGERALADQLQVKITDEYNNVLCQGTLGAFIDAPQAFSPTIDCDCWDMRSLHFYVSLPLNAGNDYQNATCNVTFSVYAEQAAHNQ